MLVRDKLSRKGTCFKLQGAGLRNNKPYQYRVETGDQGHDSSPVSMQVRVIMDWPIHVHGWPRGLSGSETARPGQDGVILHCIFSATQESTR